MGVLNVFPAYRLRSALRFLWPLRLSAETRKRPSTWSGKSREASPTVGPGCATRAYLDSSSTRMWTTTARRSRPFLRYGW